jgi:hypothetical protein
MPFWMRVRVAMLRARVALLLSRAKVRRWLATRRGRNRMTRGDCIVLALFYLIILLWVPLLVWLVVA